jgi:putative hydrolase of HD superfamily
LSTEKLHKQIQFIMEIDKLKSIYRRTKLLNGTRLENDAEHSWHLAMMAIILAEHANDDRLNLLKVLKLVLIHDLVEIDAGDTYAYDSEGQKDKFAREDAAAQRLFAMLPEEQSAELYALWKEFEEQQTIEARFASALDKLQPLIHNYANDGELWKEHDISSDRVIKRNQQMAHGSEQLWLYAQQIIEQSIEQGILKP